MRDYFTLLGVGIFAVMVCLVAWYLFVATDLEAGEFLVEDPHGDRMVLEVRPQEAVEELTKMYLTGEERWIGGGIEADDSKYGYRFDPDTIVVAEITAEGLQAVYFKTIGEDINYWRGLGTVYVWGTAVKMGE